MRPPPRQSDLAGGLLDVDARLQRHTARLFVLLALDVLVYLAAPIGSAGGACVEGLRRRQRGP